METVIIQSTALEPPVYTSKFLTDLFKNQEIAYHSLGCSMETLYCSKFLNFECPKQLLFEKYSTTSH